MNMMRLSTMWAIHGALSAADEPGPLARQIAVRWHHDPDTLRLVRSSANTVYRFDTAGERRFLRFAADSERPRRLIEAEIDLLQWLVGRGAAVAPPVRSAAGNLVETVATDAGVFHAVAFGRLAGRQLEIGDLGQRHFHAWGEALGRLHATMGEYTGPAVEVRPSWRDDLERAGALIPVDEIAVRRELDDITASMAALPVGREHCGLIHGDFELDNLRWPDGADEVGSSASKDGEAGAPGMLDFDDCATHWYAADVAFALRDVLDDGAGLDDTRVEAFVGGYRTHRPLGDELLEAVPVFSRLVRLLSYTTKLRALDLPDDASQPDWLRGLRRKLQKGAAAYAASVR